MVPSYYLALLLVRVVLPGTLLFCIALRPFGLSIIYLLLFLLSPLAKVPNYKTFSGVRGKILLLVAILSTLLLLMHMAWHTLLACFPPYGSLLGSFPVIEQIGLNLGLVSYDSIAPLMAVHYLAPELVMTCVSIVTYISVKNFLSIKPTDAHTFDGKYQQYPLLTSAGKYVCLFLIMFSGILRPSVTSGIYFLVFMGAATAWSLGRPLNKGFAVVGRCVMAIMAVHSIILLVYQCNWIINMYPPDTNFARYFGLTKLVIIDNNKPNQFTYEVSEDHMWATLASPLVILFTYYTIAVETRQLFKPKPKKKSALTGIEGGKLNGSLLRGVSFHRGSRLTARDKWMSATKKARMSQEIYAYINSKKLRGNASETTPLIRTVSPTKRWPSVKSTSAAPQLHQDSTGSLVIPDEDSLIDLEPTLMDHIVAAVVDFFQVLIRSSYIATTITMMAWSIMYHSWLTFVLLMWANIVWLRQNQRSFMLKTSPILVVYAMLLLLAQYIYGMNLTEDELPSNITEVNLSQIGLGRSKGEPCVTLLIKSLFTCMFWVTLRQRIQEIRERRQTAVIADMAAPLQLTVSTAASVIEARKDEEGKSRLMRAVGEFLKSVCARYWIYVVVIMLFVIGITGERMTIFRIIYMFLFLAFILMFQISWYWWRKLMYLFWIVVIGYSMINLMLIYVYQFDNFSKIIENYLFINEKLQHDLGLEPYDPADLFVKLLTPTLFLIITIMQVHYFHKDFMALSSPKSREESKGAESSRPSQGASTIKDDIPQLPMESERQDSPEVDHSLTEHSTAFSTSVAAKRKAHSRSRSYAGTQRSVAFKSWIGEKYVIWKEYIVIGIDLMFIYLDIHLIKIVMVALMLLCVCNVCAMHVPIMLMISPILLFDHHKQRYCVLIISSLISVYFMAKMVYQIDYISHSYFDVNCTSVDSNGTENVTTLNNAEWIGFTKATSKTRLVVLLKGYIALIATFTFYSLVVYRQQLYRERKQLRTDQDKVMFPKIRREDADFNTINCVKYLLNYGFYKFGVEVTLICLMGVIGSRMDVYAVLYAIWLLTLVSVRRNTQMRMWPAFTMFLTVVVPVQYLLAVGFLPQFCVAYPWSGSHQQMKHIRNWLFLPYTTEPPHAIKLIFDFFLLLFATLQLKVFAIEKAKGDSYIGGSNSEEIGKDWETPNFVNPVPDFLGFVGTWLDVVKRMIFLGMLWVTLAIMFMTGTNRVNLFSMGYLVGSFIFLWQGTDFYLLPKEAILQWWSWLLRYNVSVVVIKTLLQIPGCIFGSLMQEHACWLVQLLGIGCVDKFAGGNIARFLRMNYVKVYLKKDAACSVPQEDIGLAWDGVCFAFLILQRRLFHSYYFYRVIDESKATTILASRGAELIEELRQKQMDLQEDQEVKILEKIKEKMERIKANQRKIQGALAKEPINHDRDEDDEDTQQGESEQVPLVRGDSDVSARGYHTPDSPASPRGFHTPLSESSGPPSPSHTPPPTVPPPAPLPALPAPTSSHGGPPSPSSALMTASLSLDAYLEPRRISFGSPPSSDLLPRAQSPEESYPVFSPPPIRRRHTVASPSLLQRTSLISQSSRSDPKSHHTSYDCPPYRPPTSHQKAVRSGDYYMFEEFDDADLPIKQEKQESDDESPKEMGIGKLLSTAIKTDLKHAISLRRASAPAIRSSSRHRASVSSHQSTYAQEVRKKPPSRQTSRTSRQSNMSVRLTRGPDDDAVSELDDASIGEQQETWFDKVRGILETGQAFVSSFLVSVTRQLMRYSRDYRYVSRILTMEKKILKSKEGFGMGLREGSQMRWEPLPETITARDEECADNNLLMPPEEMGRKLSDISVPEIRILAPSMERGLDASPSPRCSARASLSPDPDAVDDDTSEHESAFSLQSTSSKEVSLLQEQDDSLMRQQRTPFVHVAYALWYAVLAHTDIVCYIMVFINQIQSATILSIPLPLMVFLWGTLTIPRPTKTFWVTLIAYTEVIVLIKSMFQFEILPWNQKVIPANMPFTAPRIIGIERKHDYALYDLLLLLIIFWHRFMLKSLGLWKESTPEIELREDMEFTLEPEDTQKLVEGRGIEVGKKYIKLHNSTGPSPQEEDSALDVDNERQDRLQEFDNDIATPGPSKPALEDDHYKVNDDQEPIIAVTTTIEESYTHYPKVIWLSIKRHMHPTREFFQRMLTPTARVTADIYAYMFLCDFFNFLVVIFGFAAFGTHQGDGGVQAYLEENKVPLPFLIMLILQFALIVIDRALYLRKFMLGKVLFQYALIIGVHIWMFFVLPFITERTFNTLLPPPMWYMIKCIYLLLSAYQIRCGYPRRIIGNFLCKSYRFLNMVCFRGFMAVPFVFELRTLMDWIWTDTSMTLMDWLKMEDIFANIFLLKCSRYMEDEFPQPRGMKKSVQTKYLLGGSVLAFVIAIIWFPLVFFAFGNSVGEPNPPVDVTVKIRIGPFLPVYQMSAQSHNIALFTEQDYAQLSNLYARDRTAQTFLSNYMYNDVAVVSINPNSTLKWVISPPELDRLEEEAASNASLNVKFTFVITHPSNNAQNPPTIEDHREVELPAYDDDDKPNPERETLYKMLTNVSDPDTWVNVKLLFPKFLKVFNKGTAKPAYQLMPQLSGNEEVDDTRLFRDVQLRLERDRNSMYWRVRESCSPKDPLAPIPMNNCNMLVMYTFNDKLFPETLNFISGGGIIGLYTTFVFLASRVIRGFFTGIYTKIMFDDLPNVDRILQLCLDIYLVREALELALEEDLFAKLVFLYRSPETLIKWTRPKEDENEEPQRALPPSR